MRSFLLIFLILMIPELVSANVLKADIKGGNINWTNAINTSGNVYVPSAWTIASGLQPTKEWIPGGLSSSAPSIVTVGLGSNWVSFPFEVVGFEYHTGSAGPALGNIVSGQICGNLNLDGAIVHVSQGVNCRYDKTLIYAGSLTPFQTIRPVINIDNNTLLSAFNGSPEGVYKGSVSVISFYDYFNISNILQRKTITHQIDLEIDYRPSYLTRIDIVGNNEIEAVYDLNNNMVRGETNFSGVATGWFENGLSVSLLPTRTDYKMSGPLSTEIPYNIECIGCDDSSLVKNGIVINQSTRIIGSKVNVINFNMLVNFHDIDLDLLERGVYSDSFVIIFEPGV